MRRNLCEIKLYTMNMLRYHTLGFSTLKYLEWYSLSLDLVNTIQLCRGEMDNNTIEKHRLFFVYSISCST